MININCKAAILRYGVSIAIQRLSEEYAMSSTIEESLEVTIGRQFGLTDIDEIKSVILKMTLDASPEQLRVEAFTRFAVAANFSGFPEPLTPKVARDIAEVLSGILPEQNLMLSNSRLNVRIEHDIGINTLVVFYNEFAKEWVDTHATKRSAGTALGNVPPERMLGVDTFAPGTGMVAGFTNFIKTKFEELNLPYRAPSPDTEP
jgi:hypothetical protein